MVDEIGVGAGDMGGADDEAVAAAVDEEFFQLVGDVAGAADQGAVRAAAAGDGDEVAGGGVLLAAGLDDAVAHGLDAADAGHFGVAEGLVHGLGGEVEVQRLGQQRERVDFQRQGFDIGHLVLGLGAGGGADGVDQGAEMDLFGVAPGGGDLVLDGGVALLLNGEGAAAGEDHLGPASGKAAAAAGLAGLDDDRMALGRARHGEGAAGVEVFSPVVEAPYLVGVGEQAGVLVDHQGVGVPGFPVAGHDLQELVGAVIAAVVLGNLVAAHVPGLALVERGDDVPGGAAAGEVVHRGELAGDVERLVIGGGAGGAEAEAGGGHGHGHQAGDRVELDHADAIFDRMGVLAGVAVGQGQAVVEEAEMEFSALQGAADLLVEIGRHEVGAAVAVAPGHGEVGAVLGLEKADHGHLARHFGLLEEGQGAALDPLGPEAPDPHPLKGPRSRRPFMVEGAGVSDPCWGPGQSPGLLQLPNLVPPRRSRPSGTRLRPWTVFCVPTMFLVA